MARLEPPVVFALSALAPYAVLEMPVVRFKRASSSAAVLKLGKVSSGSVMTACALGKSAEQVSISGRRSMVIRLIVIDRVMVVYLFPAELIQLVAGPEETKNQRGIVLRLIQIRLVTPSL